MGKQPEPIKNLSEPNEESKTKLLEENRRN